MKKNLDTSGDIENLVNKFYTKVVEDETIGYIFKNVAGFNFEKHIPVMVSFWETLLLGKANYKGNPMVKHMELNKIIPLKPKHFAQWLKLWEVTVLENFEGKIANEAIVKAKNIAGLIQFKMEEGVK